MSPRDQVDGTLYLRGHPAAAPAPSGRDRRRTAGADRRHAGGGPGGPGWKGSCWSWVTRRNSPGGMPRRDQCLIGPAYFENYKWLLKVVLLCATIPVFLLSLASGVIEHWTDGFYQAIVRGLTDGITNAVTAGLTGFGAVTLVFAAVERYERRGREGERRWTPADLREEPSSARFREARQPSAGKFSASPPSWDPSGLSPVPDKRPGSAAGTALSRLSLSSSSAPCWFLSRTSFSWSSAGRG